MNKIETSTRRLPLERLKALSDGVIAIVITILVLELDVPEAHDFSESGLVEFLGKVEHQIRPYFVSFVLVAGYWVLHHVMLGFISTCNRTFVWLNLLFMLTLTLTPYMTSMRADYPGEISVAALFGGIQMANYMLLLAIWHYGLRHLRESPVSPGVVRSMDARIMIAMALNIIAVLLVPVSERFSTAVFVCTPLVFLRHHVVDSSCSEGQYPNGNAAEVVPMTHRESD